MVAIAANTLHVRNNDPLMFISNVEPDGILKGFVLLAPGGLKLVGMTSLVTVS